MQWMKGFERHPWGLGLDFLGKGEPLINVSNMQRSNRSFQYVEVTGFSSSVSENTDIANVLVQ